MSPTQDQVFVAGEADRWFLRNRRELSLEHARVDPVVRALDLFAVAPHSVLEVGAANGWRLAALAQRGAKRLVAVEPSGEAIAEGRVRFPGVEFRQGVLTNLPIAESELFDLVIVSFVLHWVDRRTLFRSVAEIDRAVADGGMIAIADFSPDRPARVPYHHLPDARMYTFKQDYAAMFVASATYRAMAWFTFDHASHDLRVDVPTSDRCAVVLLAKSLADYYEEREQP